MDAKELAESLAALKRAFREVDLASRLVRGQRTPWARGFVEACGGIIAELTQRQLDIFDIDASLADVTYCPEFRAVDLTGVERFLLGARDDVEHAMYLLQQVMDSISLNAVRLESDPVKQGELARAWIAAHGPVLVSRADLESGLMHPRRYYRRRIAQLIKSQHGVDVWDASRDDVADDGVRIWRQAVDEPESTGL